MEKAILQDEETRVIGCEKMEDGRVRVYQMSEGDTTQFVYDSTVHKTEIRFTPTEMYGLADVIDIIREWGDDVYITDICDSLNFWEVQFDRLESDIDHKPQSLRLV